MKIIVKERGKGKTTALIHTSAITGYRILANTSEQARYIKMMADNCGFKIPKPMSITEYLQYRRGRTDQGLLIDDLEVSLSDILNAFFETNVVAVTMSVENLQ